jgi:hypothetical protein
VLTNENRKFFAFEEYFTSKKVFPKKGKHFPALNNIDES